jgi:hypothetical protein
VWVVQYRITVNWKAPEPKFARATKAFLGLGLSYATLIPTLVFYLSPSPASGLPNGGEVACAVPEDTEHVLLHCPYPPSSSSTSSHIL